MSKIALGLLFATSIFAQYTNVYVAVSAPTAWQKQITDSLTQKLNAIPDVQVVDKAEDSAFTISVDVNSIIKGKDDVIGYSMMALIYGSYDRAILIKVFDTLWKDSKDKFTQQMLEVLKYTVSGNVFLAGTVHTHGPLGDINDGYDMIVGKLKTTALPEWRRFQKMLAEIPDDKSKTVAPTSRF